MSDGLSCTVFVGEHTNYTDKTWVGVVPRFRTRSTRTPPPIRPPTLAGMGRDAPSFVTAGRRSTDGPVPIIHPPSFPTDHCDQMYGPWSVRGGNVLFGDGHVAFITADINLNTWAALSSMQMGDIPGPYGGDNN